MGIVKLMMLSGHLNTRYHKRTAREGIIKEGNISLVVKYMGTAQRNFVDTSKAMTKSFAGKWKLMQQKIAKIQNNYGIVIIDNCSDTEI